MHNLTKIVLSLFCKNCLFSRNFSMRLQALLHPMFSFVLLSVMNVSLLLHWTSGETSGKDIEKSKLLCVRTYNLWFWSQLQNHQGTLRVSCMPQCFWRGGSWSFRQASHLASLISSFIFRPRGQPTLAYLQCRGFEHTSNAVELSITPML